MRSMRRLCTIALLACGCLKAPPPAPEPPPPPLPPPPTAVPAPPALPRPPTGLYGLEEAVDDALSGELSHVGTGAWNGNARVKACAYRNDRVLVVDVYCTVKEVKAFRVDVFSPTRGWARIYAEARAPVSTLSRRDYFTFTAETQPPPGARTRLPPVTLAMSFPELVSYDGRRYRAFLPSCFGGVENGRRQGGCLGGLASHASAWGEANRTFLREPPESWYRLVTQLRTLARQHGEDPP
jgi:hypothetical protein